MKICVIMGSPRKKDSYRICKLIEENFSSPSSFEFVYVHLKDYYIEDCKGCDQCFQKGEANCPCKDDLPIIKEKLSQADGIIFASPVYACQITGLMKRTIDRLSYLFHRQEFVGKPAITIVTTAGGGQKPTAKYLKMTACGWGCHLIGELQIVSSMFFESDISQSPWGYQKKVHDSDMSKIRGLAHDFESAVLNKKLPSPSFYDIFMFQCLRSKTYASLPDYLYWEKMGWLDSPYFYKVKINIVKLFFGRILKSYVDFAAGKMMPAKK